MRSVADIPGDADDDLPEISPELVLVDPELARQVREDAAAAAAAAPSRDRDHALRLVTGAARVDDRADDAEPAEQAIVPRQAVTEGSRDADDRQRVSQVEDDELVVPRAVGPTEPSATAVSDPVGEPEVEAPSASHSVVATPAVVAHVASESELVPGALPTVSEPVGESEVVEVSSAPEAVVESQAVVAEAEPASGLVPGAVPTVAEPVGEPELEASSASQAVVATPPVVGDPVPGPGLVPGVVPTVSDPTGERAEADEPSSPEAIVVPTTVPAVAEPASENASDAFPIVARRVVDAEPARVVAPRPGPAFPVTVPEPAEMAPEPRPMAMLTPAMPHPIARPGGGPTRAPHAPRGPRRGRGAIAFLASVAVASLAVLGILNLTGGTSSSGALPASGESGPSSAAATGEAQGNDPAKAKAAAKARAQAAAKAKAQAAAKARARAVAATKAKAEAAKTAKAKAAKAATTAKTPAAPATRGAAQSATTQRAAPAAAEPRRFAWAPVEGAIAYHVELFRGGDRVLAEDTPEPVLQLGPTWRYEGKIIRLTKGSYRWYVWPVTKGGRTAQAVVQATLTVP